MRRNRVENKLRNDLTLLLVGGSVLRSWRPLAIALLITRESYCERKWRTSKGGGMGLGAGPFEALTGDAAPATARHESLHSRVWWNTEVDKPASATGRANRFPICSNMATQFGEIENTNPYL